MLWITIAGICFYFFFKTERRAGQPARLSGIRNTINYFKESNTFTIMSPYAMEDSTEVPVMNGWS